MLNSLTMTPEQEAEARNKAFYLLKKYTSYTWLNWAATLSQSLLDGMVKLLNEPKYALADNENAYKTFLTGQIPVEDAPALLKRGLNEEAYQCIYGLKLPDYFTSPGSDYLETYHSEFFIALGLKPVDYFTGSNNYLKNEYLISNYLKSGIVRMMTNLVVYHRGNETPENFETLFDLSKPEPEYDFSGLPCIFPLQLPICNNKNTNSENQIWSGKEIEITGIYEPWLISGDGSKVGCPNYYLAGQEALEYQLEGTEEKEKVRWRLIWEDKRYLDGNIPMEEEEYLKEPSATNSATSPAISAQPGSVCAQGGTWTTHAMLEVRSIQMKEGEKFPIATQDKSGNGVIWYWKSH